MYCRWSAKLVLFSVNTGKVKNRNSWCHSMPQASKYFRLFSSVRYLDGRTDYAIKKLCQKKEILIPLFNDAFTLQENQQIIDLESLDSGRNDAKSATYNFQCRTVETERIIVEMQR